MPPRMGLEFLWEWVFYKYIAPTALGFASKFTLRKIWSAGKVREGGFRIIDEVRILTRRQPMIGTRRR